MTVECPCGSGQPFTACCHPMMEDPSKATTAEQVMRARYTAYARANIDYLKTSMHPKGRHEFDAATTRQWAENSEWLGFEVLARNGGGASDDTGTIEFIARYRQEGRELVHHEVAEFVKEDGTWFFTDGKVVGAEPIRRTEPKIGRNEPCPCGSGRKYKKCCGADK